MRSFNVAGPCDPTRDYMVPPESRMPDLDRLLRRQAWFVVHAPRQSGKTTAMRALARRLTAEGVYAAVHVSVEAARAFPDKVAEAERAVLTAIESAAAEQLPPALAPPSRAPSDPGTLLATNLQRWAERCPRPLVLILDEIDGLEGNPLRSVLSQLRAHFPSRPAHFPSSVILCGMRDVRDYKLASGSNRAPYAGSSSPFNVKEISLRLSNFSADELAALYLQHTTETGRPFTDEALARAYALTEGQPWLVNALAREIVVEMGVEPPEPITASHVDQAKERLIQARATHLDRLLARLHEDRVRRVIDPIIAGEVVSNPTFDDDFQYVVDLGLVSPGLPVRISNPIYREVMLRVLALPAEAMIAAESRRFVGPDGRLDVSRVLDGFLGFWRENGEILASSSGYPEAASMLVFMAWLHRVVNGGGFIEREVGVGRRRVDVLVRWPWREADGQRQWQLEVFELKVWRDRDKQRDPTTQGLRQLDGYLDRLGLSRGVLLVFDARAAAPPMEERCRVDEVLSPAGRSITVLRA